MDRARSLIFERMGNRRRAAEVTRLSRHDSSHRNLHRRAAGGQRCRGARDTPREDLGHHRPRVSNAETIGGAVRATADNVSRCKHRRQGTDRRPTPTDGSVIDAGSRTASPGVGGVPDIRGSRGGRPVPGRTVDHHAGIDSAGNPTCPQHHYPVVPQTHDITYPLDGSARSADITYQTPTGSSQQQGIDVPMDSEVR